MTNENPVIRFCLAPRSYQQLLALIESLLNALMALHQHGISGVKTKAKCSTCVLIAEAKEAL